MKIINCKRYFKDWSEDGKIVCFGAGRSSFTANENDTDSEWDYFEVVEDV